MVAIDYVLLKAILAGAWLGVQAAALGYFVAWLMTRNTDTPEEFDGAKFTKMVLLGALFGGAARFYGTDVTTAQATLEGMLYWPIVILGLNYAVKFLVGLGQLVWEKIRGRLGY